MAWITNMLVPKWFEQEYGLDKAPFGWYVEIKQGEYSLLPYGVHPKTKEEWESSESKTQEEKRKKEERDQNIVRTFLVILLSPFLGRPPGRDFLTVSFACAKSLTNTHNHRIQKATEIPPKRYYWHV